MSVGSLLSWMACGLVVGLIARALVPDRQRTGLVMTMVLGVVGAVAGGLLFSFAQGTAGEPFSLAGNAWHGWVAAVLGGILVVWGYVTLTPQTWRP